MSALDDLRRIADALDAEHAELIEQARTVDARLCAVRKAISLWDAVTVDDQPEPATVPTTNRPGPERVACPDCGELFDPRGLGPHRRSKHKDSAAKPVELRPVPSFDPDAARARAAASI